MPVIERWTEKRLAALSLVADGKVDYSLRAGTWEPQTVHRWPAFDWLSDRGYIDIKYDARPSGRVLQLVPAVLTDKGRAYLYPADAS